MARSPWRAAFEPLTKATVRQILTLGVKDVEVVDIKDDDTMIKALRKDPAHDEEEALKDIYRKLRPGDPPTIPNAKALLKRLFFDPKKYDLSRVGRHKINEKLGMKVPLDERVVTVDDFIAAVKYLIKLRHGQGMLDDIDHLGSRRVRTVGELLANQCRVGLARTERLGEGAHDPVRRERRGHDAAEADQPEGSSPRSSAISSAARN
jgi:DNA-directed RNA polymerase subunit beta